MATVTCARCSNQFSGVLDVCPTCGAESTLDLGGRTLPDIPSSGGSADSPARELVLQFHGRARDYFRIWAVNLCLSLLTLGIFSAWAKVRRKRYFYSSTTLDGTPFQYVGQPGPILRGRVAAATLFGLYYTSTHFVVSLLPYVLVAGALLAPWVLVCSAAFNARYSAFRNMTFRFDGTYWDVLRELHAWGLFPALVIGTAFQWFGHDAWAYASYGAAVVAFPFWQRRFKRFIVDHTSFGGCSAQLDVAARRFLSVYLRAAMRVLCALVALMLIVGVLGLIGLIKPNRLATTLIVTGFAYAAYVMVSSYAQARISNLVWNHTRLGPLRFRSSLSGNALAGLYLTNTVAILGSLGFLIPWAAVRTTHYRLTELRVILAGDIGEFEGQESVAVPAMGAELGGFFDIDLSL